MIAAQAMLEMEAVLPNGPRPKGSFLVCLFYGVMPINKYIL